MAASTTTGGLSVADALESFLTVQRARSSGATVRAYTGVLTHVTECLGADRALAEIGDDEIAAALEALWGRSSPATWNRNRAAVRSWLSWCTTKARWNGPSVPAACERRREPADATRAVDQTVIDRLCSRRDIGLRERLLWRMLYETASRATAVLELNVDDLDLDNRRVRIRIKGGDTGWITWGRGTAMLLPRYLRGREAGPLFCSERRPGPARRATVHPRDLCPETGRMRLGYDRARTLINAHAGLDLHQLRHSAATHLGDAGVDVTVIMAKTHHRSIRTAARYTRPGLAAVTTATEALEPPRRRS